MRTGSVILHLILVITLAFRCFPASASENRNSLEYLPNDAFWRSDHSELVAFFTDLERIMNRLRGPQGTFFSFSMPYNESNPYFEPVCSTINSLSILNISQILFENNSNVIRAILEEGMFSCFRSWKRLDFKQVPGPLIPRLPIEYFHSTAFKVLKSETLAEIILSRSNANLFKKFDNLILRLPADFWKLPAIMNDPVMRIRCSAFHLTIKKEMENLSAMSQSSTVSPQSQIFKSFFKEPFGHILEFSLNMDNFLFMKSGAGLNSEIYAKIMSQCKLFNFAAQTHLHDFVMSGGEPSLAVILIVQRIKWIRSLVSKRARSFPDETVFLQEIMNILRECFSFQLYSILRSPSSAQFQLVKEYFGSNAVIEYLGSGGTISSLFGGNSDSDFVQIHPEFLLQIFIMTANEEEALDSSLLGLVEHITGSFGEQKRSVLPVLLESIKMLQSFGVTIKKNRHLAHSLYTKFCASEAPPDKVRIIREMIQNDYEYVKSIVSKGPAMDHSKYAVVFEESFRELDDDSRDLNYHVTSRRNEEGEMFRNVPKFGAKMAKKKRPPVSASVSWSLFSGSNSFVRQETERSYSLVSLDDEDRLAVERVIQITLPELSLSFEPSMCPGEYIHVDYFLDKMTRASSLRKRIYPIGSDQEVVASEGECHPEILFVHAMLEAFRRALRNPGAKIECLIQGTEVSGFGLLKDSLTTFGRLLSLPRFKTLEFSEAVVGFIPQPLLCPKVMGFIGIWMALSLKNRVPLAWTFAPVFRKFLFDASDQEDIDKIIEVFYAPLFESIRQKFSCGDEAFMKVLPRMARIHRPFELPGPHFEPASPFLIEGRFLEQVISKDLLPLHLESDEIPDLESYLIILKGAIRRVLEDGRMEFRKCFMKFFKTDFVPFITYYGIEGFIGGGSLCKDEIWEMINFSGTGAHLRVVNDFDCLESSTSASSSSDSEGTEGDDDSCESLLGPTELFKEMFYRLSPEELELFLLFATGMHQLTKNSPKISFYAVEADGKVSFCRARTCFNQFSLVIHKRSARATFENFLESIKNSSGFSYREF